jgi:hypothetical protein
LSIDRGAKQLEIETIQQIFSASSSFIFASKPIKSVCNSSFTKQFSRITGMNPFFKEKKFISTKKKLNF